MRLFTDQVHRAQKNKTHKFDLLRATGLDCCEAALG